MTGTTDTGATQAADTDSRLIRMHVDDNILVLAEKIAAGTDLMVDGHRVRLADTLPIAHKIASVDIATGETILKYGAPIGRATADISRGAHVHVHNIESAYTPTYVLPEDAA
jgi:altronate dehydratase